MKSAALYLLSYLLLTANGSNGAKALRGERRALGVVKCEKSACLAPPQSPEDDPLEEEIFKFAAEAALDVGATAHPAIALGATGFKLFTNIYNSVITSGDTKHNPLDTLKKDMQELVASSNEVQDINNQAEVIAQKLRDVRTDLSDYHAYYNVNNMVKAKADLARARETCESLHDLVNSKGTPGVNGVYWLRSRLAYGTSYCNLCSYVWSISRAVEQGDPIIQGKLKDHIDDCAITLPNFVDSAITERMRSIPKSIDFTQGGASGDTSKVCHPFDWDGYYNYRATDGGKPIVEWMGKGICHIPTLPLAILFGPAAATGSQVECPATDGGPGTIGHEADRCIMRYRKAVLNGMIKRYAPIIKAGYTHWFTAKVVLESSDKDVANDLVSNPLKHDGSLFGEGFMQYDEVEIKKYHSGLHDVKTICHKKCMGSNLCVGFGYRVDDRFDGRTNGNCWFLTGALSKVEAKPLAQNPEFGGYWVKNQPGVADTVLMANLLKEYARLTVEGLYENLLH